MRFLPLKLLSVTLLLVLAACETPDVDWTRRPRLGPVLFAKHFEPLYDGAPTPPRALKEDVEPYLEALNASPQYAHIKNALQKALGDDITLWFYALADIDRDGTLDWMFNPKDGRFYPNDPDMDGDGVLNLMDSDPFSAAVGLEDRDGDRIPDPLDWSHDWDRDNDGIIERKAENLPLSRIQEEIFRDTGIFAIHQDARHSLVSLRAFRSAVTVAYGKILEENRGRFPRVKFVTARAGRPDEQKTLAWYSSAYSLVAITDQSRKAHGKELLFGEETSLEFYATLIHELAHALQARIEKVTGVDEVERDYLSRYWKGELFRGKNAKLWIEEMDAEIDRRIEAYKRTKDSSRISPVVVFGHDGKVQKILPCKTDIARRNGIISTYALKSPQEYFAESVAAYVLGLLAIKRFVGHPDALTLRARALKTIERDTTLQPANLPKEGIKYLDSLLDLSNRMQWDPDALRADGKARGQWIYKN